MTKVHLGARVGRTLKVLADDAADLEFEGNTAELVRRAVLNEAERIFERNGDRHGISIVKALRNSDEGR